MYTFPILLKKIREESGLSQKQLADVLDVSEILVTLIETDKKEPSRKFINKLASKLEVSPSSITPFMIDVAEESNLSLIERKLFNVASKIQEYLISKKSHNLNKYIKNGYAPED